MSRTLEERVVPADALRRFGVAALVQQGVGREDAEAIAEVQVTADMRGVHTHGVSSIPGYCKRLQAGGTTGQARPRVVEDGPAYALVDGDNGHGQLSGRFAMALCVEKGR